MLNDSVESFCVIYNKQANKQTKKNDLNNAIVDPMIFRCQFLFQKPKRNLGFV